MSKSYPSLLSFNAGELSPSLVGRTDIKQYGQGCFAMENMIPTVQGPAKRRPGTYFVNEVRNSSKKGAITEFVFNIAESFILEWGDFALRFYLNHEQVMINSPSIAWNTHFLGHTIDGALTWTNWVFPVWAAGIGVAANTPLLDSNGNIQVCTTPGTTGATRPVWGGPGETTNDNTVVWTCLGVPQWQPLTVYAANAFIYTNVGIQQVIAGGGGMSSAAGTPIPYEIPTPYSALDLYDGNGFFQLIFTQSADVVYITHRSKQIPAYKLSRFADTNWSFTPVDFVGGPFADQNPESSPIVFASAKSGKNITLSASADIFDPLLMGAFFQLTQQNIRDVKAWQSGRLFKKGDLARYNGVTYECIDGATTSTPGSFQAGTTPPTHYTGTAYDGGGGVGIVWLFRDSGYGFVQLKSRGTDPTGASVNITNITQAHPPVVTTDSPTPAANGELIFITGVSGMTDINDRFYRVSAKSGSTFALQEDKTGGSPTNVDATSYDAYSSGGTADNRVWTCVADVVEQSRAAVTNRLPATVVGSNNATSIWAAGAWNNRDGYPTTTAFFRGRLALARSGQIWLSVAQDFENFSALTPNAQVTADMAITITLPTQDDIHWLVEGRVLVAGTASAEHSISEINPSQAFGPANVATKVQLRHGSCPVRPMVVGHTLLWMQTSARKLWGMKYDFGSDNYIADNLTHLNDVITQTGIVGLAYQQEPDEVVWAIRNDGLLIALTFNEEDNVIAWHRHPMPEPIRRVPPGTKQTGNVIVESIAVIPAADGSHDELWMLTSRFINGTLKRYIEYMKPAFESGGDITTDAFYVDCGITYNGAPTTTITGLSHLEDRTVKVLADGSTHPDCNVIGGQITLNRPASVVHVGIGNVAKVTTMPLLADLGGTASRGTTKRVISTMIRFQDTVGGEIGNDEDQFFDVIEMREPSDPMDEPVQPFSGIWPRETYDIPFPYGYEDEGKMTYRNSDPLPATLVTIYPEVDNAN